MSTPAPQPRKGVPVERVLIVLAIVGVIGLIFLGVRGLIGQVTLQTAPVTGEWQAKDKPWHLTLRSDKTVVSSAGSSEQSGTYSVNYFGTLWVKLNDGRLYTAELVPGSPNRFDLIELETQVPTVFERVQPPESAKNSPG